MFESSVATGKCGDGLKTNHGFLFLRFVSYSTNINLVLCVCVCACVCVCVEISRNSFLIKNYPTNYGLLLVKPVVIKW